MDESSSRNGPAGFSSTSLFEQNPALRDDPYPLLNHMRENHPLYRRESGEHYLFRHADIVRLLRDIKVGVRTTDGILPGIDESVHPRRFMLWQDPPNHARLRRLVSKGFTPPAIERMRGEVQALVDSLLDRVQSSTTMDVIGDLARPLPSTVICQMIGVPLADGELFVDWTTLITHRLAPQLENSPLQVRANDARAKLEQYFRALIAERRLNLGDDLLSTLIRAEEAGDRLSSEELIVQALGLLVAGFETTIGLIGNGVRQLLLHPDQLAKLREQPALIGPAVEECLRFDGPIQGTRRVLHEDAEFAGQLLPENSVVFASFGAAHRDPRAFQDPDRFWIEREPNPHLAFGGGPHFCLGVHLARLEAQIAISTVCRRFPNLALDSDKIFWGESLFRIQSRMPVRLY